MKLLRRGFVLALALLALALIAERSLTPGLFKTLLFKWFRPAQGAVLPQVELEVEAGVALSPTSVAPAVNFAALLSAIHAVESQTTVVLTTDVAVPVQRENEFPVVQIGDRKLLSVELGSGKMSLQVRGTTTAGVPLSQVQGGDIQVGNDRITISLPPAKILKTETQVLDQTVQRDWFGPSESQLLGEAQSLAPAQINAATCSEVLNQANARAEAAIQQALASLGYAIEVRPAKVGCASS